MAKTSIKNIKQEFVNFLRNQDILSISTRGVTTATDNKVASLTGSETFTVDNSGLKNVRSVEVNSTAINFGEDYTIDLDNNQITVLSVTATDTVDIEYDYGTTDRIFPDYPQPHLKLKDFPRIGFDLLSGTSEEFELGAGTLVSDYVLSINAYDANKDNVGTIISDIRSAIIDNKKNFYYIPFITITNLGPEIISPFGEMKIIQRNQDCDISFVFED